jgi:hypothetical protein
VHNCFVANATENSNGVGTAVRRVNDKLRLVREHQQRQTILLQPT